MQTLAQTELDAARLNFMARMASNASSRLQCCSRAVTAVMMRISPCLAPHQQTKHLSLHLPTNCLCFTANHRSLVSAPACAAGRLHHTAPLMTQTAHHLSRLLDSNSRPCSTECLKLCVAGYKPSGGLNISLSTLL